MQALPKHLRDPHGKPDVQMVAQRLLAREKFQSAGGQFNILAASWIQAMVHDWIGHIDGEENVVLDKGAQHGCPFFSFRFKNTKMRSDGNFNRYVEVQVFLKNVFMIAKFSYIFQ